MSHLVKAIRKNFIDPISQMSHVSQLSNKIPETINLKGEKVYFDSWFQMF
jgi:hypothetical protein